MLGTNSFKFLMAACTHKKKNRQEVILKYFRKIRQMLQKNPIVFHLKDSIAIDNTQQYDPKLDDLKRRIFELASNQPYWGEEKPARWILLEQKIMTLKVSGAKVVPLSLIEDMNMSASVRLKDRNELELFLSFQHEIGTILYFSDEGLREKIVLDPQWMINVLSSLITAESFIDQNPDIITPWYDFQEKGKLTHTLIDAVWKEKQDFHDNKKHILLLMEKLNIIARPLSYTEVKEEDYYFAPCMLQQATPKEVICPKLDPKDESTSVLCYVCKGKFLPTPIFHRLLGACLTRWHIAKKKSENQIYCGCCVFDLDHHHTLTLHLFGHVIFARAIGRGVTVTSQSSKLCTEARTFIYDNLHKITKNLGQSLQFEMHIQCPNCDPDSTEGLFAVSLLRNFEQVVCRSHDEYHTLVSKNMLRLWFEDVGQTVMESTEEGKETKLSEKVEVAASNRVSDKSSKKGEPCSDPTLLRQLLQKSQQAGSSSQSTLEATCLSVGLELHGETPADGNCFFEAISSQLRRLNCVVQKSPQELRQEVVAFMRTNRVIQASEGTIHLDCFICNESFDVYCSRMAMDSQWADHVVVVAMARMLQMDIMIVTSSPSSGPENIIVWVVGKTAFQDDPILLGHVWESHYLSLQPTGRSVDDTDRFMHIACLLVDVGSKVLRRLLLYHTVTPTCTLDQYLVNKRTTIDNLRQRKILNKSQMAILFPPGGSTNLGDYDITLLSALFTNIVLNISPQQLNMIQSLRDKRNEIFAHAKSVTVSSNDYQTFWKDISKILEALSKPCGDPDFEKDISKEIERIQVSTVQGTSLLDTLPTLTRKMETLEKLVLHLMLCIAQKSNKESDASDS
ncbi:hypothetical protein ACJMK2_001533 [Sinanodonta woodiana]|uniref:OTU domain-containing protein n=1 Tax=Sinanodonta woodiana TaxID=1069815 RepID=A0ABD3XVW9_SINWO